MQARASFAVNSLPKNSFNVLRLMGSEKSRRATLAFVSNAKGLKFARGETNDHTSASSEWKICGPYTRFIMPVCTVWQCPPGCDFASAMRTAWPASASDLAKVAPETPALTIKVRTLAPNNAERVFLHWHVSRQRSRIFPCQSDSSKDGVVYSPGPIEGKCIATSARGSWLRLSAGPGIKGTSRF